MRLTARRRRVVFSLFFYSRLISCLKRGWHEKNSRSESPTGCVFFHGVARSLVNPLRHSLEKVKKAYRAGGPGRSVSPPRPPAPLV